MSIDNDRPGLDELEGLAASVDMELTPSNFQAEEGVADVVPAGPDYAGEASACVEIFAGLVCGVAPSAAVIWTDEAKGRTSAALSPVLSKYGLSLGNIPPELTLAIVAGPLLWQSARAVSAEMERAKKKPSGGVMEANPAPNGGTPPAPEVSPQVALYPGAGSYGHGA